ncbi:MAG: PqiC family protein, partial [Burkholderiaceae bacterium]
MIASAVRKAVGLAAISASLSTAMLAGGCASTPPESFYTLRPVAPADAASVAPAASSAPAYSLVVGPVRVPEIVDRPQLVVRKDGNEVAVLEQQRWAQPLQAEIAQALAADLSARLPQARVIPDRDAGSANADVRVTVDVTRFDAVPGAFVMVESLWTIR